MKIEDQVCSLELSMKLKELGIRQDSFFYFVQKGFNVNTFEKVWEIQFIQHNLTHIPDYMISSFTVSELGKILPHEIWYEENRYFLSCEILSKGKGWLTSYQHYDSHNFIVSRCYESTEANSRADLLIYLLKNNILNDEWKKQWMVNND